MEASVDSGTGRPESWGSRWSACALQSAILFAKNEVVIYVAVIEPVSLHREFVFVEFLAK